MATPISVKQRKELISVSEARRILGKTAFGMSDTQIIELIQVLQLLAKQYLRYNGSKKAKVDYGRT